MINKQWLEEYAKRKSSTRYQSYLPEAIFIVGLTLTAFYSCYKVRTEPIDVSRSNINHIVQTNGLEKVIR